MLLEINKISKRFGDVEVLQGIDLKIAAGEILGLAGENGAGKSTLMNLIGGIFPPSGGQLLWEGQPYEPRTARDAQEAGIAFIHQSPNLFPNLNIAENLLLHHYPWKKAGGIKWLDHRAARKISLELLKKVGLNLSPDTLIEELSPAQQQLVEIAKALSVKPRLVIFDEPTTSLSRQEAEQLFALIRKFRDQEIAVIYISHQLEDMLRLSDRIAILRDGQLVADQAVSQLDLSNIVRHMIGREMKTYYPQRKEVRVSEKELLRIEQLRSIRHPEPVSFSIKQGEIVGFYGLIGAGRSELARVFYGLDPHLEGRIFWKEKWIKAFHPKFWIRKKVGFLTEDRHEEGLLLSESIFNNISLVALPEYTHSPVHWVQSGQLEVDTLQQAEATRIRYQDLNTQAVSSLSGGNQQKVVLAKWLLSRPDLLVLDEPTKGVDISAKWEIYQLINDLTGQGSGIWLISSEIEELLGLCDRILVMNKGRITGSFHRDAFEREAILEAALLPVLSNY